MICLDTNIVIYAVKPSYSHILHLLNTKDQEIACSEMVRLESMGFPGMLPKEKVSLDIFFENILILPIDSKIIDQAIKIRLQKAIDPADAIIAATAMLANKQLWTNNVKDFSWIQGLDWHNPIAK